jgi:hypothetical protein
MPSEFARAIPRRRRRGDKRKLSANFGVVAKLWVYILQK